MCDCCSLLIKENRRLTEEIIDSKLKIRDLKNEIKKLKTFRAIMNAEKIREEILDENKSKNLEQDDLDELFDVKAFDFDLE